MKHRFHIFIMIASFAVLLTGCANYHLGDVKPSPLSAIHKIYVPPFRNLTLEPRLSSLVTNAVLIELQSDGSYQVANRDDADAVLVGTIRRIRKSQLRAVRTDTLRSRELSIYLYIDFHLEHPTTGARIGMTDSSIDATENSDSLPDTAAGADPADGDGSNAEVYGARPGHVVGQTIQFVDQSYQVGERNAFSIAAENAAQKIVSQLANGW